MEKIKCKVPFGTMNISMWSKSTICNTLAEDKQVTNGPRVREFEEKFAKKFKAKHAIAVSSGTDADTIALASLYKRGLKRGDGVIIPALTFVATANAVVNAGFVPVFIDVEADTLNMDACSITTDIVQKYNCKAVMPVHLMGKPCNMKELMYITEKHGLLVVEDCAEAHGAEFYTFPVGAFGTLACYSLYAAHIVSSIEGGMITTNDDELADTCKNLRNHGLKLNGSNWTFDEIGFSSKMNELEAIVGIGNLESFDEIITKRKNNYIYLQKKLDKFRDYIYTIKASEFDVMSPHAFALIVNPDKLNKEKFVEFLTEKGIDNRNLFYSIPTQSKCYEYLGYKLGDFPNSESLSDNGTHIGIHQDLTIDQLNYVVTSIEEFVCQCTMQ